MSHEIVKAPAGAEIEKMDRDELEAYVRHLEGLIEQQADTKVLIKLFAQAMTEMADNSKKTATALTRVASSQEELAAVISAGRGRDFHGG